MGDYPLLRGAEPFYFRGDRIGCLLVHGFTGSPWEMRWLGERLAGDGRTVLGVRLAGHGTCPADMNDTRWPDWYASVAEGYGRLRGECEQVFVLGLSLGGALALRLALDAPLDGLVLMATPLHIRDWRITLFRPFQRWIPYWRMTPALPDESQRDAGLGYEYMPTICLVSMLEFFAQVQRELARVEPPTLLVYSRLDPVAGLSEMRFIAQRIGAAEKHSLTLERGGHVVCNDVERETVLDGIRGFVGAHAPAVVATSA